MIGLLIFILIIGGFIGLLYFNTVIYGKSDYEYSENNMMYNLESVKEHTKKIINEDKEEKKED